MNKYCVSSVGYICLVHSFTELHRTWTRVFNETQLFTVVFVLSSQLFSQHGGVTTTTAALQVCFSHNDDTVAAVAASNWVFFLSFTLAFLIKISLWDILRRWIIRFFTVLFCCENKCVVDSCYNILPLITLRAHSCFQTSSLTDSETVNDNAAILLLSDYKQHSEMS